MSASVETKETILRDRFGFSEFRPGQGEAIDALLTGGRLICIQPTGHGKSILYQLPSVMLEGITLVVSPLLALMRDQVGQLRNRFKIPASAINSDQTDEENQEVIEDARSGRLRILFVAPEQLDNLVTRKFLVSLPIDLFVVDEAHCISTWGHDFRPSYRQILHTVHEVEALRPGVKVLGLTATANRRTEEDMVEQFRSRNGQAPEIHREAMERANLSLSVSVTTGLDAKLALLSGLMNELSGSGILYCATREQTEIVAGYLAALDHDVVAYHAGLPAERKRELQGRFTEGGFRAIAATNALGMGIDKSDIRFIVHVDVPGSITSYYQEVGRAGRDGEPARGILLFEERDRAVQEYFIHSSQPDEADFQKILEATLSRTGSPERGPTRNEVGIHSGLHPTKVVVILAELVEQGFVEKRTASRKQVYERSGKEGAPDLSRYEQQRLVRTNELEAILKYGRQDVACLMQTLRSALGDGDADRCGRCSLCEGVGQAKEVPLEEDLAAARRWIVRRELVIQASKVPKMSSGIALLDGEVRSPTFVSFMRRRGVVGADHLDQEVLQHLTEKLLPFAKKGGFGAIVPIPSRTWSQRQSVCEWIADQLGIPVLTDLLVWESEPANRQGELFNNDQRRSNVSGKMGVTIPAPRDVPILLVDDYIGSGATLKEATRALRKRAKFDGVIAPFAIARVRWRLGARGMI